MLLTQCIVFAGGTTHFMNSKILDSKPVGPAAAASNGHVTRDNEEEPSTGEAVAARGGTLPSAVGVGEAAAPSGVSNTQYLTYPIPKGAIMTEIDYLTLRFCFIFSLTDPVLKPICLEILEAFYIKPEMMVQLDYGNAYYDKGYQFGPYFIIFSEGKKSMSQGRETMLIELKGSGCDDLMVRAADHERFVNGDKNANPYDPAFQRKVWSRVFKVVMKHPHKVTRLDIPTDDISGIIPLDELKRKCACKEYVSRMRKPTTIRDSQNGQQIEGEIDDSAKEQTDGLGWTFEMGRRTSAQQLCIYDKREEFLRSGGIVNTPHWIRFEVRFYRDRADEMFEKLVEAYLGDDPLGPQKFIVGCLPALIEFKERRLSSDNTYKAETWGPWKTLIAQGEVQQLAVLAKKTHIIKENALWIAKACSKDFLRVLIAYREDFVGDRKSVV